MAFQVGDKVRITSDFFGEEHVGYVGRISELDGDYLLVWDSEDELVPYVLLPNEVELVTDEDESPSDDETADIQENEQQGVESEPGPEPSSGAQAAEQAAKIRLAFQHGQGLFESLGMMNVAGFGMVNPDLGVVISVAMEELNLILEALDQAHPELGLNTDEALAGPLSRRL